MLRGLERVPRADLHHPGLGLDLQKVGTDVRRIQGGESGIASYANARSAQVNQAKSLVVGDVEHIPAELKLMLFAPRHVQCLCQSKIDVRISRQAKVIARATLARIGVSEVLVNRYNVTPATAEKFWCAGAERRWSSHTARAGVDRIYRSYAGLVVPVGCPTIAIER